MFEIEIGIVGVVFILCCIFTAGWYAGKWSAAHKMEQEYKNFLANTPLSTLEKLRGIVDEEKKRL